MQQQYQAMPSGVDIQAGPGCPSGAWYILNRKPMTGITAGCMIVSLLLCAISLTLGLILYLLCYIAAVFMFFYTDRKMISEIKTSEETRQLISQYRATAPELYWGLQNYHTEMYQTKSSPFDRQGYQTERVYNRRGHYHTRAAKVWRNRRVDGHSAIGKFQYTQSVDESAIPPDFDSYGVCQLTVELETSFVDTQTASEYARQKQVFVTGNRTDQSSDLVEGVDMAGLIRESLVVSETNKPMLMDKPWIWTCGLCGCGCCYLSWLHGAATRVKYTLKKKIVVSITAPTAVAPIGTSIPVGYTVPMQVAVGAYHNPYQQTAPYGQF